MPSTDPIDIDLPHGYRLRQVQRFARLAALNTRFRLIHVEEAAETALSAMIEALYAGETPPASPTRLTDIGRRAIQTHVRQAGRMYGVNLLRTDRPETIRNHVRYWHAFTTGAASPETAVVENLAVRQILDALQPHRRRILETLAAHRTTPRAAAALGMTTNAFTTALGRARRDFYRHWHQGERPAPFWRANRRTEPSIPTA